MAIINNRSEALRVEQGQGGSFLWARALRLLYSRRGLIRQREPRASDRVSDFASTTAIRNR